MSVPEMNGLFPYSRSEIASEMWPWRRSCLVWLTVDASCIGMQSPIWWGLSTAAFKNSHYTIHTQARYTAGQREDYLEQPCYLSRSGIFWKQHRDYSFSVLHLVGWVRVHICRRPDSTSCDLRPWATQISIRGQRDISLPLYLPLP